MRQIQLVLATRNAHKVEEIRAILGPRFVCLTLRDFPGAPAISEDAGTFAGNATKKAVELADWISTQALEASLGISGTSSEVFVLADDSGLEVDALQGAPGVHSARFAALDSGHSGNSTDTDNNAKLLRLLAGVPEGKRTARFRCVIALTPISARPIPPAPKDSSAPVAGTLPRMRLFEGVCEGTILSAPSGAGGFGYDPLFIPNGFGKTFAELGDSEKNRISHRAQALVRLQAFLAGNLAWVETKVRRA